MIPGIIAEDVAFQSTLPVRGGTLIGDVNGRIELFQSTLPVRGGTQRINRLCGEEPISIHPPRAGRDAHNAVQAIQTAIFQSTLPVRGGTGASIF